MTVMQILLTNDDGIESPGIAALADLVAGRRAVVVAPDRQYSACGHQATTRNEIPVTSTGTDRWRVSGTPVDCVRLALTALAPEATVVLSGINLGGNLGVDLYMSGTVAAAREAALLGRRAIALSHYCRGREPDWGLAVSRLRPVLADLLARPHEPGSFWNVNLPHPDHDAPELEAVDCDPDTKPLEFRYEREANGFRYAGDYHARPRTAGGDVDVCFGGRIAVSRIQIRGH